nr:MAG TPA: hypothetical protein [Caudoviricetes sp.]
MESEKSEFIPPENVFICMFLFSESIVIIIIS